MAKSFDVDIEMNGLENAGSAPKLSLSIIEVIDNDQLPLCNKDFKGLYNNLNNGESSTGSSCNSSRENSPKVSEISDSIYSGSELGYQTGSTYLEPSSCDSMTSEDSDSNCNLERNRAKQNLHKANDVRRLSLSNQRNNILHRSSFENSNLHLSNLTNDCQNNSVLENGTAFLGVHFANSASGDLSPVSKKPRLSQTALNQATTDVPSQGRLEDITDRKRRFLKTAEILRRSGLMEITMKTAELLKRNQELQKEIDLLKLETKKFYDCVLSNPENVTYNANLRNHYVRTKSSIS